MIKLGKIVGAVMVMSALVAVLPGCQKPEGPAEHAGRELDQAADKAGNKVDKATETLGEQIEKTGDSIQDAAKGDKN